MSDTTIDTSLRRATARDWDGISALLTASALTTDGARDHLDGFVVAEHGGKIVGCATVERYGDAGLLRSVAVRETERGTGLGVRLVDRCLADAKAQGLSTMVLLTLTAERFFPRFGFRVIDRAAAPDSVRASVEFKGACPASATVMQLDLR